MKTKPTKQKPRKPEAPRTTKKLTVKDTVALDYDEAYMQVERSQARLDLLLQYENNNYGLEGLKKNTILSTLLELETDLENIKKLLDEGLNREGEARQARKGVSK
jgi:hypothetical protein